MVESTLAWESENPGSDPPLLSGLVVMVGSAVRLSGLKG